MSLMSQTGCNPASAFASFSKRSSAPNPHVCDGLHAFGSSSCRCLTSSQPQAVQAEGNITIPCEFCGVQLEEETLFHHQVPNTTSSVPSHLVVLELRHVLWPLVVTHFRNPSSCPLCQTVRDEAFWGLSEMVWYAEALPEK